VYTARCIEREALLSRMLKKPHRLRVKASYMTPSSYCVRRTAAGGTVSVYQLDCSTNRRSQNIATATSFTNFELTCFTTWLTGRCRLVAFGQLITRCARRVSRLCDSPCVHRHTANILAPYSFFPIVRCARKIRVLHSSNCTRISWWWIFASTQSTFPHGCPFEFTRR
jgi:hypothetical protein